MVRVLYWAARLWEPACAPACSAYDRRPGRRPHRHRAQRGTLPRAPGGDTGRKRQREAAAAAADAGREQIFHPSVPPAVRKYAGRGRAWKAAPDRGAGRPPVHPRHFRPRRGNGKTDKTGAAQCYGNRRPPAESAGRATRNAGLTGEFDRECGSPVAVAVVWALW